VVTDCLTKTMSKTTCYITASDVLNREKGLEGIEELISLHGNISFPTLILNLS